MKRNEYYDWVRKFCNDARLLSERKNNDYADPEARGDDPFAVWANFTAVERIGVCDTETGFLVRIMDKVVRISNLLRPGHDRKVKDESLEDTLQDLHNYTVLLAGFREAVKKHGRPVFKDAEQTENES